MPTAGSGEHAPTWLPGAAPACNTSAPSRSASCFHRPRSVRCLAIRSYGQGVEESGFKHLIAYDHVLGADPSVYEDWDGPYDIDTQFHEPFVLFGFLAACTSLELASGIVILPQRQTALVAKQAAEVDILTDGRFRLGVGIGWNPVEYESLARTSRSGAGGSRSRWSSCAGCGASARSLHRRLRPGRGRRAGAAACAAAHTRSGSEGHVREGLPARRPARRRMVSVDSSPARSWQRPARRSPTPPRRQAATRPRSRWRAASTGAGTSMTSSAAQRAMARGRRDPSLHQHDGREPPWGPSTGTSARWPPWPWRSSWAEHPFERDAPGPLGCGPGTPLAVARRAGVRVRCPDRSCCRPL